MDAYNLYHIIKQLWANYVNKNSGEIMKANESIKVCVWTNEGYREVRNAMYNEKLKMIELKLDQE